MMERTQVITTLESLANGIDPTTGRKVDHEVLQTTGVLQALSVAAQLLREPAPPPTPVTRLLPPAAGARWTPDEDARLTGEFDSGMPIRDIAHQHGRTTSAITLRLVKLGRIAPETVTLRDRGNRMAS
jgi:hypothetical protein